MTESPILPYPDFLSPVISQYLKEVTDYAGRHLVFVDLSTTKRSDSQAMIDVPPNLPAVAIFVDKAQINPSVYRPPLHDPLLAHEITHLQLNSQGWTKISFNEDIDLVSKEKLRAIENWLVDPIINQRIAQRGFSMGPNRNHEIKTSIRMLRKKNWSYNLQALGLSSVSAIRLFVSFCLEPQISRTVKASFREAFRGDLPGLFDEATELLGVIEENSFGHPRGFEHTATLCMQKWRVDPQEIKFVEIQSYSVEERKVWAEANPPEDSWL